MKKLRISLSAKIRWGFLIILFPTLITFLMGYKSNKEHLERLAFDDLTIIADSYEGQVYQFLEMSKRRVQDFGSDGFIRDQLQKISRDKKISPGPLNDHLLRNKLSLDKTIHAIYIISMDGRIVASSDSSSIGRDVSGEPLFVNGKEKLTANESSIEVTGSPSLAVSGPIMDRVTGKTIGVLVNSILLTELKKVLSGELYKDLGAISSGIEKKMKMDVYLVNKEKSMFSESRFLKDPISNPAIDTPLVDACLKSNEEGAGFYKNYRGIEVAGAVMCMPSIKWALVVEMPNAEILGPVRMMERHAIVVGAIIIGLIGMFSSFFYRWIVRPVETVCEAAEAIARGDFKKRVAIRTGDEIEKLADSINNMALGIEGAITNLEGMVQQRTEELEAANVEMIASNEELQASHSQMEATTADLEEANQGLAEANDELKGLNRLKTYFLQTISHELRSPLSPILGYLELMRDGGVGELTSEQKEVVAEMHICTRSMQLLVDELLEVASIQAGNILLEFKEVDLSQVLQHAVKEERKYADEISTEIEVKVPADPVLLVGDSKSLSCIFTHLLRNAVKFSREKGKVEVEVKVMDNGVEVTVSDRGIGIPQDKLDKIFDVFYQVDSSPTRRFEGVGLGLYLVKKLTDLHKGTIRVKSKEGEGTAFSVFIPSGLKKRDATEAFYD